MANVSHWLINDVVAVVRGIGQIFFLDRLNSCVLILLALFLADPRMAGLALLGSLCGLLASKVMRLTDGAAGQGLYGFNGALLAMAMGFFYRFDLHSVALGCVLAGLSVPVYHFMWRILPVRPHTLPFVALMWLIFYLLPVPAADLAEDVINEALQRDNYVKAFFSAFGQIAFIPTAWIGSLVLGAYLLDGRIKLAVLAVAGSLVGLTVGHFSTLDGEYWSSGLMGYSSVLAGVGFYFYYERAHWGWYFLAMFMAAVLSSAGTDYPVLTAPFVLALWSTALLKMVLNTFGSEPEMQ